MSEKIVEREAKQRHTSIRACDCASSYMDTQYGKGLRVHNMRGKDGKPLGWECTSCGKDKPS